MSTFTPLEVIESLDVESIDADIDRLQNDIAALKELRKVAARKNGASDSGNSAPRKQAGPKPVFDDAAKLVVSALQAGPLSISDAAESTGVPFSWLRVNMKKIPGIQKTTGGEWEILTGRK